jgi:hypothetical protein
MDTVDLVTMESEERALELEASEVRCDNLHSCRNSFMYQYIYMYTGEL